MYVLVRILSRSQPNLPFFLVGVPPVIIPLNIKGTYYCQLAIDICNFSSLESVSIGDFHQISSENFIIIRNTAIGFTPMTPGKTIGQKPTFLSSSRLLGSLNRTDPWQLVKRENNTFIVLASKHLPELDTRYSRGFGCIVTCYRNKSLMRCSYPAGWPR